MGLRSTVCGGRALQIIAHVWFKRTQITSSSSLDDTETLVLLPKRHIGCGGGRKV